MRRTRLAVGRELNNCFKFAMDSYSESKVNLSSMSAFQDERMGSRWSRREDILLSELADKLQNNWVLIAKRLDQKRTPSMCQNRWSKVLSQGITKGPWTEEEDRIILKCIETGIKKWSDVADRMPGTNRIGKQCRERWINHLNPELKRTPWTQEEDQKLKCAQSRLGNLWTKIALELPGRSENDVKNRWNSCIQRKRKRGNLLEAAEAEQGDDDVLDSEDSKAAINEQTTGRGEVIKIKDISRNTNTACSEVNGVLRHTIAPSNYNKTCSDHFVESSSAVYRQDQLSATTPPVPSSGDGEFPRPSTALSPLGTDDDGWRRGSASVEEQQQMVVIALSVEQLFFLRKGNSILEAALLATPLTTVREVPCTKLKSNQDFTAVQECTPNESAVSSASQMYSYPPAQHRISSSSDVSSSPLTTCESHASFPQEQPSEIRPDTYHIAHGLGGRKVAQHEHSSSPSTSSAVGRITLVPNATHIEDRSETSFSFFNFAAGKSTVKSGLSPEPSSPQWKGGTVDDALAPSDEGRVTSDVCGTSSTGSSPLSNLTVLSKCAPSYWLNFLQAPEVPASNTDPHKLSPVSATDIRRHRTGEDTQDSSLSRPSERETGGSSNRSEDIAMR